MADSIFNLTFEPGIEDFHASRFGDPYTALVGPNNSGKSLVLKALKLRLGRSAYMVGPQRFYHVHQIASGIVDPNELENLENQFTNNWSQPDFNHEANYLDLSKILLSLSDDGRAKLFDLCGQLIGSQISLKRFDEHNELSMRYVDIEGRSISVASTGTRLLMTILGICLDNRFSILLVDEPELGLSPRVQQALARFLADPAARQDFAPHLQAVFVATHSHLFIDRREIRNNFVVDRHEESVGITQTETVSQLHRLQFNMLGNSLEDLFLPAAIVVVEGQTDHDYLSHVIQNRFPESRITVIPSNGDVKGKVHSLKQTLGDLQKSPLRDRLFVVVDSAHSGELQSQLESMGVLADHFVAWDRNGIEYLYPASYLADTFSATPEQIATMEIVEDVIELNGVSRRKVELAAGALAVLSDETDLPTELETKLLEPISRAIE